jgi:chromosome segregation ATPase
VTVSIGESTSRYERDREALQNETRAALQPVWERIDRLSGEFEARRADIETTLITMNSISARIDACVERLDRQGAGIRSLHGAYSQHENDVEQIVEGLVRLRALPRPSVPDEL